MRCVPAALQLLTDRQIAQVRARSDCWGIWLVVHAWAVIGGSMTLVICSPHLATYLLAVMLIGSRQLGLLILMHDGAHGVLTRSPILNRFVSQWCCAYPMLADMTVYRRYHLQHHAHTMQEADPDVLLTGDYPISRTSLRRKLMRDISGRTGIAQRFAQFREALGPASAGWLGRLSHLKSRLGWSLLINALLFVLLMRCGHPWFYITLWVLPALTWHQLVLRIRNIAEHAAVSDRQNPFLNARTTAVGWIARGFVAPYWVNYHREHHLLMWVPCYRLRRLQQFLAENGLGYPSPSGSYLAVLHEVTYADEASPPDGRHPQKPRQRAVGTFSEGFRPN